jgi:putative phage-type endonuclease
MEWLKGRKKSIGASEVASVLGLHKYGTPWSVYKDKTSEVRELSNDAIKMGILFEPHIYQIWADKMHKTEIGDFCFYTCPTILKDKQCDRLTTNLDGWGTKSISEEWSEGDSKLKSKFSESFVVEIKHVGIYASGDWKSYKETGDPTGIFLAYWLQVQAQLAVTGLSYGYLVVLIDKRLEHMKIDADVDVHEKIRKEVSGFWKLHVETLTAPEPDALDMERINALHKKEEEGKELEKPDALGIVSRHRELQALKKEKEKQIIKPLVEEMKTLEAQVALTMGDAEVMSFGDDTAPVTWKTVKRKGHTVKPTEKRRLRI